MASRSTGDLHEPPPEVTQHTAEGVEVLLPGIIIRCILCTAVVKNWYTRAPWCTEFLCTKTRCTVYQIKSWYTVHLGSRINQKFVHRTPGTLGTQSKIKDKNVSAAYTWTKKSSYTVHLETRIGRKLVHLGLASGRPVYQNFRCTKELWYTMVYGVPTFFSSQHKGRSCLSS